jgi:hypothetical protein
MEIKDGHQGAEHVDGRVADPVVAQFQSFRHFHSDL